MTEKAGVCPPNLGRPYELEPDGDVTLPHHWWAGVLMMVAGFLLWQPQYDPTVGAALAGLGLLVALDDYLSHAFGWWTPLDAAFKKAMTLPRFRRAYISLLRRAGR